MQRELKRQERQAALSAQQATAHQRGSSFPAKTQSRKDGNSFGATGAIPTIERRYAPNENLFFAALRLCAKRLSPTAAPTSGGWAERLGALGVSTIACRE
jgi:hypothetical protein